MTQVIWGLLPFYSAIYPGTPAAHVLVCRVLACTATMATLVFVFKQQNDVFALFRQPKRLAAYTLAALLLGTNWMTFFWAVQHGHVLEISFATYLMPLFSIAMGVAFLREKLTRWTAAGLAAALAWKYPRGRWLFATLAMLGVMQRVATLAHYPSDALLGAALGVAGAALFLGKSATESGPP